MIYICGHWLIKAGTPSHKALLMRLLGRACMAKVVVAKYTMPLQLSNIYREISPAAWRAGKINVLIFLSSEKRHQRQMRAAHSFH